MGSCTQAGPGGTGTGSGWMHDGRAMTSPVSEEDTRISRCPIGVCWQEGEGWLGKGEDLGHGAPRSISGSRCKPGDVSFPGLSPHSGTGGTGWSWVPSAGPAVEGSVPRGDAGASHPSVPVCQDTHRYVAPSVSPCHAACLSPDHLGASSQAVPA